MDARTLHALAVALLFIGIIKHWLLKRKIDHLENENRVLRLHFQPTKNAPKRSCKTCKYVSSLFLRSPYASSGTKYPQPCQDCKIIGNHYKWEEKNV